MKTSNYFVFANTSATFQEGIADIQQMPQFFEDALDWGIDASYAAFGFMVLLSLAVKLFSKK